MSPRLIGLLALLFATAARADLDLESPPPLSVDCDDLDLPSLGQAIERELASVEKAASLAIGSKPPSGADYAARSLRPLLRSAQAGDRAQLCGVLKYSYSWRRVGPGYVGFTAYHTPTVRGSLTRDDSYRFPLYRRPRDAAAHDTTAQVLGGGLANRNLELVWLADAYDALALHVEGAGVIQLPDGSRLAVGSDGNNGQPYQNVSKLLAADHALPSAPAEATHQPGNPKARAYFAYHPEELNRYWSKNAHFVFFRRVDQAGGGKFGALVPGRSLAVDAAAVPLGALVYVRAQKPVVKSGAVTGWTPMSRLMLAQDTGAGIRGQRMDLYFGDDDYAQIAAQSLTVQGDAWVLMAK